MLLLASASSARRRLLQQAGISYRVMVSGIKEEDFESSTPSSLVKLLALAKANAVESKLAKGLENSFRDEITSILGCDSVFVFENEIFGKPRDTRQAIERWERMSSKSGLLMTGYALRFRPERFEKSRNNAFTGLIQDVITTRVEFEDVTTKEIEEYVMTGEPLHCAGGFALEGKAGILINKIEGCYSNVIGLSLPWLRKAFIRASL